MAETNSFQLELVVWLRICLPLFTAIGAMVGVFVPHFSPVVGAILGSGCGSMAALMGVKSRRFYHFLIQRKKIKAELLLTNINNTVRPTNTVFCFFTDTTAAASALNNVNDANHATNTFQFLGPAIGTGVGAIAGILLSKKENTKEKTKRFNSLFRLAQIILLPIGMAVGALIGQFVFALPGGMFIPLLVSTGLAAIGGTLYSIYGLRFMQYGPMHKAHIRTWVPLLTTICSGIGAAIGTFLLPVLGTVAGAAAGAGVGALIGYFVGHATPDDDHLRINNKSSRGLLKKSANIGVLLGTGIGALLGSVVFPGLGTFAGMMIGASLGAITGATIATSFDLTANHIVPGATKRADLILGSFGMGIWWGSAIGAGIGALIGTFAFPGLGTIAGAAIGSAFGGIIGGILHNVLTFYLSHKAVQNVANEHNTGTATQVLTTLQETATPTEPQPTIPIPEPTLMPKRKNIEEIKAAAKEPENLPDEALTVLNHNLR